jgi:2-(1,2-epoxy-1,2-dihydrophenyl)acetyl-CoA isomerase
MTSEYPGLLYEKRGAVAILTFNRPAAGNAIDLEMGRALMERAIECDMDDSVRAVLLRSDGKLFCAGGDVAAFAGEGDRISSFIMEETAYVHSAIARLARMEKPLVVAVQGFAAGAGFSFAILGDIVLAGRAAQFTAAYTGIGVTPDGGMTWMLPRLVGLRKAQEIILLNTRITADEALALGMVTRVVEDEALQEEALKVAEQLAAGPTVAYSRVRELLLSSFDQSLETQMERESRAISISAGEPDGKEGIAAFAARRAPQFAGQL